jgi:hypothetical protein
MLRAFLPFDLPEPIKQSIDEAMSALVRDQRPARWRQKKRVAVSGTAVGSQPDR